MDRTVSGKPGVIINGSLSVPDLPTLMTCFNHSTQRQTLLYICVSSRGRVGPNKLLAQLASDMKKPDGLTIIRPDEVSHIIGPLPIKRCRAGCALPEAKP